MLSSAEVGKNILYLLNYLLLFISIVPKRIFSLYASGKHSYIYTFVVYGG